MRVKAKAAEWNGGKFLGEGGRGAGSPAEAGPGGEAVGDVAPEDLWGGPRRHPGPGFPGVAMALSQAAYEGGREVVPKMVRGGGMEGRRSVVLLRYFRESVEIWWRGM